MLPAYFILRVISWAKSLLWPSLLNSFDIWNLSVSFSCLSYPLSVKCVSHGNVPAVRSWQGPEDPRREQVRWGGKEAGGHRAGHQGEEFHIYWQVVALFLYFSWKQI